MDSSIGSVLFDLNILGKGFRAAATRTGIFRTTEHLVRALVAMPGLAFSATAHESWVSELQLLRYARRRNEALLPRIVRSWDQPMGGDAEGAALLESILQTEEDGGEARRERAALMLLNAGARRTMPSTRFDVLHSLRTPLPGPDAVRVRARALMIHDLIPLRHPEWMYDGAEAQVRGIVSSVDPAGDFVFANSKATARDVMEELGISEARVFVTPLAADRALFRRVTDRGEINRIRARYGIPGGRFLLSVSTLEPRKNLVHLIASYAAAREALGDVSLVLAGPVGWKAEEILGQRQEGVVRAGYVEDADLAALYSGALAFVYPSLHEGFGLPVLEAMQCGTPVICSDNSSLPEVTGDAAILVPATERGALEAALLRVAGDAGYASGLGQAGLRRAAGFSWERTAELTVAGYQAMLRATG